MGFQQSPHEVAICHRGKDGNALLVGVYVNDLVITGTKEVEVQAFKEEMKAIFQMSDLGLLSFYLGIEVHQDSSGISLRQAAYAKRIVELGGLTGCNLAYTPMEERLKLSRDSMTKEVDATQFDALWGAFATSSTRGRVSALRQPVHATTNDRASTSCQEDPLLRRGHHRLRLALPEVSRCGTLHRVQRQ
jgi:hypothetical protein